MRAITFLLLFSCLFCFRALAQDAPQASFVVKKAFQDRPLIELIEHVEANYAVRFFFDPEWIRNLRLAGNIRAPLTLDELLKTTFKGTDISFSYYTDHYIFIHPGDISGEALEPEPGKSFELSGIVEEGQSGDALAGVGITVEETGKRVVTGAGGRYSLSLPFGVWTLRYQAVGLEPETYTIRLFQDTRRDVSLFESITHLREVMVTGRRQDENIHSVELGSQQLGVKTLKSIPPLLGEPDVVRAVLLLPGVSSVGEGSTGFNVRGGNVDQNLILIDGAPIYNSAHMFGLFSVVNSDVISGINLQKGPMNARYGGRLSSILNVNIAEGNEDFVVEGSLGLISSKLKIETPVGDKTTIVAGGRYAYPNWILKQVDDPTIRQSSTYFMDVTAKIVHRFSNTNKISLTTYYSDDAFRIGTDTTYAWSNSLASLQWQHAYGDGISARFTGYYTRYRNNVNSLRTEQDFNLDARIENLGINYDVVYAPEEDHRIEFGLQGISYLVNRGNLFPATDQSNIAPFMVPDEQALELSAYINDEYTISARASLSVGLRYSHYLLGGPLSLRVYQPDRPKSEATVIGTETYGPGEVAKEYSGLEPRLAFKYGFSAASSIKLGYNRNFQYINLLSNTAAVSPADAWKLSDQYVRPQRADQLTLGYFRNFRENSYESSVELYYKDLHNITEYKEGARLLLNEHIEQDLLSGRGKAYGVEWMLKKQQGQLTGWLSYTYSRSLLQVAGPSPEETLSNGEYFPGNFDKPHDLSFVSSYNLTKRLSISTSFVYSTGRPITYPESVYLIDGYVVANYSQRNQARIPDYHRLDISVTYAESLRNTQRVKGSWSLGVYNAYARRNPFSVFFQPRNGSFPQAYQLSMIGSVVPYITYNFKIQ